MDFIKMSMPLIHLISVMGILILCIIELNKEQSKRNVLRKLQYTILVGGSLLSGFQPFIWASVPAIGSTAMSVGIFSYLCINEIICSKRRKTRSRRCSNLVKDH